MSLPLFIPDVWTHIVNTFLEPESIEALGGVCKSLHHFTGSDAIWQIQIEKLRQEYHYTAKEVQQMRQPGGNPRDPRSAKTVFAELFPYPNTFIRS
jgi:hypothetical protein